MDLPLDFGKIKQPLTVCNGMGWNSWAMLVGMYDRGIRPDLIITANTGSEHNATYEAQPRLHAWLEKVGFPAVTYVSYEASNFKNWPPYYSLEDNCLTNGTLPSLAFGGRKSCSAKWKVTPQLKFMDTWQPAMDAWNAGLKVIKCIGFDASPQDAKRTSTYATIPENEREKYDIKYPLLEWGWDREECGRQIKKHGLFYPDTVLTESEEDRMIELEHRPAEDRVGYPTALTEEENDELQVLIDKLYPAGLCKSSCFFCPAMKTWEVRALPEDELKRIVVMEARAKPRLTSIEGLWGVGIKGTRGGDKRPGSMTQFIRDEGLLPAEVIDKLIADTPKDIVSFQEGYAQALKDGTVETFIKDNKRDYRHQMKGQR